MKGNDILTAMFGVMFAGQLMGNAQNNIANVSKARVAIKEILKIVHMTPVIDILSEEGAKPAKVEGNIAFTDCKFAYPARPDAPVMRGFSLNIPAGKTTALVGQSGSGKSTTIQLVERFYDPDAGVVTLDGRNLNEYNVSWLRDQISLVGQEPVLFSGTIAENIANGKPGCSRAEIEEAAKSANAYDFIMQFADKFETQVGDGGGQLSGGQKQRVAIARAIIRDPPILLLDEATSALDNKSERVVQDALDALVAKKARTTIVIAHRLSTIRNADQIVVVDQGRVVETGTHEELIQNKEGAYSMLLRMQGGGGTERASNVETKEGKAAENADEKAQMAEHTTDVEAVAKAPSDRAQSTEKLETKTNEKSAGAEADAEAEAEADLPKASASRFWTYQKKDIGYIALGCVGALMAGGGFPCLGLLVPRILEVFFSSLLAKCDFAMNEATKAITFSGTPNCYGFDPISKTMKVGWPYGGNARNTSAPFNVVTQYPAGGYDPNLVSQFNTGEVAVDWDNYMRAIDAEWMTETSNKSYLYGCSFLIVGVGVLLGNVIMTTSLGVAGERLTRRLRHDSFKALVKQDIGWYDNKKNNVGQLTAQLADDAALVRGITGDKLGNTLQNLASLAVGLSIGFYHSLSMTLIMIGIIPVFGIAQVISVKFMVLGTGQRGSQESGAASTIVNECVQQIRTVNSLRLTPRLIAKYKATLSAKKAADSKQACVAGFTFGAAQFLQFGCQGLMFWSGARLMSCKKDGGDIDDFWCIKSSNDMMTALFANLFGVFGLAFAAANAADGTKANAAAARIMKLLDLVPVLDPTSASGAKPSDIKGHLTLKDVDFSYPSRKNVTIANKFSLDVPAGKTVALVGQSGSGKSTTIQLVERFYDPDAGVVTLDGRNLNEYNVSWLRDQISLVGQEPVLFSGTIAENIANGKPGCSRAEIEEAAKSANAFDFIMQVR
jgi:ATP-binding cassette subfamily B (MDR/TAP) protein 1